MANLLLENGADVLVLDKGNWTLLHHAAQTGPPALVELLLGAKLDINARQWNGETPLHKADSPEIAKLLLDHGADINVKDKEGLTPIDRVFGDTAEFLAKRGAMLDFSAVFLMRRLGEAEAYLKRDSTLADQRLTTGCFPLDQAIYQGWPDMARLLLDYKVDVNKPLDGAPPVYRAASEGRLEILQMLLDHGAKVDALGDLDRETPLTAAARQGNADVVRLLLKHGADVNGGSGCTPLYMAAAYGRTDVVRVLLDAHPADARHLDRALFATANGGGQTTSAQLAEVARLLIARGADIEARDDFRHTALVLASLRGSAEVVALFLDKGAKVNVVDNNGSSALHHAAFRSYPGIVNLLLSHGAEVNVRNADGDMPLHLAARHADIEVVRALLEHKADATAKDKAGKLPWELADDQGQDVIAALLRKAAGNP